MFFSRKKNQKPEQRAAGGIGEVAWLAGGREEITTAEESLKVGAVYSCVRVIAETVATLPCILYRRLPNGGKERAVDHPLYQVLHDSPNEMQDTVQFFEMLTGHVVLRGNAFAYCDFGARTTQLIPLNPQKVQVKVADNGRYRFYEYNDGGRSQIIRPENMLHIHGLSSDGVRGLSPIELAMKTVNVARKQELYADSMFANKASPGGVLTHPGKLSEQAAKRLKEEFDRKYAGTERSGSTLLLEDGLQWQQIGLSNEQAQFIEGRKFSRGDIAMWFRVPPHKIGDLDRATFSNIEHQALEFVTDTIRPWLVRWEKALLKKLFTEEERNEYVIEFLVDAILRGDTQSRYAAYAVGRQWGWLSVDEIRERENLNPLPNDAGTIYLQPMNMVEPEGASKDEEESNTNDEGANSRATKTEDAIRWEALKGATIAELGRAYRRRSKIRSWDAETTSKELAQFLESFEPILKGLQREDVKEAIRDIWLKTPDQDAAIAQIISLLDRKE